MTQTQDAHITTTCRYARTQIADIQANMDEIIDRLMKRDYVINSDEMNFAINRRASLQREMDEWFELIANVYADDRGNW